MLIWLLVVVAALGLASQVFIGLTFFLSSIRESERRASVFAGFQLLGMLAVFAAFLVLAWYRFFHTVPGLVLLLLGYAAAGTAAFFLLRRTAPNPRALQGTAGRIEGEVKRFDERTQVFARNRSLRPGSDEYRRFYEEHPEYLDFDLRRKEKGGPIGHPGVIDRPHEEANVAMMLASQNMCMYLSSPEKTEPQPHFFLREKVKDRKVPLDPEEATRIVKGFALHLGSVLVGITEPNPLWMYSHRGEIFHENWEDWGKEIRLDHKYVIVLAEEMSLEMIGSGPHTPTTIESMNNYAKGAYISAQIAAFIANLGYSATANHLRHYDGLMAPLAVDAGLGEVGRLGYLITKEYGPRVRLSAVTTDLPLVTDKPVDIGVEDFCEICKKCSVCCPSGSIPMGGQAVVNGTLRWKLNEQTCFDYWGKIGTDCNVCMRVCPWSHARTFPHRVIVALITRNRLARRIFSAMDDLFYGRKPKPKTPPKWVLFNGKEVKA
ncbi:MAG: reductive dehalogenase [Desulfobacteraceae bacterium]|nr:MAG: reductive dehalogenase [Desulfobacteraceae bacterium]